MNVLAALTVQAGSVVSKSHGVCFFPETGEVTFPNPQKLAYAPVVSDYTSNASYITELHYLKKVYGEVEGKNPYELKSRFTVWKKVLDTGSRNSAPTDFTAIVVGFVEAVHENIPCGT